MKLIKGLLGNVDMARTIHYNIIYLLEGDEATTYEMAKACKKFEKWFKSETGTTVRLTYYLDDFLTDIWHIEFSSKLGCGIVILLDD